MKSKIAIGLLILFCIAEIRPVLPFLEYVADYDYISEVLCINKEKPMLNCDGKCYLSQQLKKAQESEKQEHKFPIIAYKRIPMLLCAYELPKFIIDTVADEKRRPYYSFSIISSVILPPTPPPKC